MASSVHVTVRRSEALARPNLVYIAEATPKPAPQLANHCSTTSVLRPVSDVRPVPFRWVCRVVAKTQKGHSVGSAMLMSPWHALTMAHVIYPLNEPYQTLNISVCPGYTPELHPDLESNGWAVSPHWDARKCTTNGHDWGLIRLKKPVPSSRGFWNLRSFNPNNLPGTLCNIAGYPADKRRDPEATQMFQSSGRLLGSPAIPRCTRTIDDEGNAKETADGITIPVNNTSLLIVHDVASAPSMSGGPVWIGEGTLVAIHAGVIGNGQCRNAVLLPAEFRQPFRRS